MAFGTGYVGDQEKIGAGENYAQGIVLASTTFENGLNVGRFAKIDSGSLDNLDASATPNIAGVVLRDVAMPVEDGSSYDNTLYKMVEYQREGLVTVQAVTGQTPTIFGAIYAENQTGADYGKATTTSAGNVDANAEFIKVVDSANDIWQIRLK